MRTIAMRLTATLLLGIAVPVSAEDVPLYGRFELDAGVDVGAAAEVVAQVEAPSGATAWPTYWHGGTWWFRYQPVEVGDHAVTLLGDGAEVGSASFHAEESALPGPLHADGYGFRDALGEPFVPLGLNLGWSDGGGTDDYAHWFGELAGHGGNFARVWITHFTEQDPEWPDLDPLNETAAANVDTILDLAEAEGVRVMLVLWQHSELETMMWSSWETNPYNEANGGPCADSAAFFEDDAALAHQQTFLRYAVARWGPHPALGAWEIMNEVDGISGVSSEVAVAWARAHAHTIRELEHGRHPVSWSCSLPEHVLASPGWEGADFSQVHSYLLTDVAPVADGVAALLPDDAPVLVGEWGLDWFGDLDHQDTYGRGWHNASWAAVASGSAGNALTWWWDSHVDVNDLWWRLHGLHVVLEGLDLPSMAPVGATVEGEDLEAFARSDGELALVWLHDRRASAPEPIESEIEGAELHVDGFTEARFTFHDTGGLLGIDDVHTCNGVVEVPMFVGDVAAVVEQEPCLSWTEAEGCGCRVSGEPTRAWWVLPTVALVVLLRRLSCR